MENKKVITIIVLLTTVILAVIALFTAVKLYQIGKEPVTASPLAKPKAARPSPKGEVPLIAQQQPACQLAFNVGVSPSPSESPSPSPSESPSPSPSVSPSPTPSVSPSPTPSGSPSPTPSSTPQPQCWDVCSSDSQCPGSLVCQNISGVYRCINASCPTESDCVCGGSPAPSPIPSTTPLPGCWDVCSSNSDCSGGLVCQSVSGVNRCVNSSCATDSDCVCGASAIPQASTVATQKLPEAGFVSPTLVFSLGGLALLLLGLLF